MALTLKLPIPSLIKRDIDNVSLTVLFILCPLLSLPWVIKKSYNGEKYSQLLLSIFIGLVCVLAWPPQADLYRHYITYENLRNKSFDYLLKYYIRFDLVLPFLQYVAAYMGIPFEIIRIGFISTSYYLMLLIYNKLSINITRHRFILFLIILYSVPFIYILRGLRYGFAMMLMSYFILKRILLGRKSKSDFIFPIISILTHFSSVWLIGIYFVRKIFPNRLPKYFLFIICIGLLSMSIWSSQMIQLLPRDIIGGQIIDLYSTGGASKNHLTGLNFWGLLTEYSVSLAIMLFIIICVTKIPYDSKTKILFLIIFLWTFTLSLFEINRRVGIPIYIMGGIYIFQYLKKYIIFLEILYAILISCSVLVGISFARMYLMSNIVYIMFPLPIILLQTYDYEWIKSNVDSLGTLLIWK